MVVGGHGDWHPRWRSVEASSVCWQRAQGVSSSACLADAQRIWCLSGLPGRLDAVPQALVGEPAGLLPCRTRLSIENVLVDEMSASSATMVADGGQREVGMICF